MGRSIIFNILMIILVITILAGLSFAFFVFTLPVMEQDFGQQIEEELLMHNQKLELIQKDFSYVLSDESVSAKVNENIELTIAGEVCGLKVVLTRKLNVRSITTIDYTAENRQNAELAFAGEIIATIVLLVWLCFLIRGLVIKIRKANDQRRVRKLVKNKTADIEVVI